MPSAIVYVDFFYTRQSRANSIKLIKDSKLSICANLVAVG